MTTAAGFPSDNDDLIRNRDVLRQVRNFKGMRFGPISPTDIDAFFEIGDRVFLFIETKHNGAVLPKGQRLAFERLVTAVSQSRRAILIVGRHDTPASSDIDVASCLVSEYYEKGKWHGSPFPTCTVRNLSEMFVEMEFQKAGTT